MKKALVFGSTGLIGSYLLTDLLNNPNYEQVTIVVRQQPKTSHPRLKVLIGDFNSLPNLKKDLVANDVFIALGTTKKKTPDQSEYYKIDHDYPVLAAKLAKENGASSVFFVSSVGATTESKTFYIRTKGETERDLQALGYEHTHLFRPSMLMGEREEHRSMEKAVALLMPLIDPLLVGKMKSFKSIQGKDVASAIVSAAQKPAAKMKIYQWSEMQDLLQKKN